MTATANTAVLMLPVAGTRAAAGRVRRLAQRVRAGLESLGRRRAAQQLQARAELYDTINPGFAQELRAAVRHLRTL